MTWNTAKQFEVVRTIGAVRLFVDHLFGTGKIEDQVGFDERLRRRVEESYVSFLEAGEIASLDLLRR